MELNHKLGGFVMIPILGIGGSFMFFFAGNIGWGLLGIVISFIILMPLAFILADKFNLDDMKEEVCYTNYKPTSFDTSRHESYISASRKVAFYSELESRQRIFADSNKIVQTTNNFETFERRMTDLLDHIEWSYRMQREGMPAKVNMTYEQAIADWGICYNDNAVRIAKHISVSADTAQKAKNRIPKIEQIRYSLKDAPNKRGSGFAIDNLLSKLKSK